MTELNDRQKIEYLQRSYLAVDGLWFVKVEETYNFKKALYIDEEVWKIMPKIQARMLKSFTGHDLGLDALKESLEIKFSLDGFKFRTETPQDNHEFSIVVQECPWFNAMIRSKREKLADEIGKRICVCESSVWANEFGSNIKHNLEERLCGGSPKCVFKFFQENSKKKENE